MTEPASPDRVTLLLSAIERGDEGATDELLPIVYGELRRLAAKKMAGETASHTLQATALVHEAYLRLVGDAEDVKWENRAHFFGAAAHAMRRILVERARRVGREKRGGGRARVLLDDVDPAAPGADGAAAAGVDLVLLDEALLKLEAFDPRLARIVSLRFFAGLSVEETASATDLSPRTVKREWSVARAWLHRAMSDGGEALPPPPPP